MEHARTARTGAPSVLRKALSHLLTLALAFSLCGLPAAYGAEAGEGADGTASGVSPQAVTASGDCGDSVTWALEDGTLTISGSGDMADYGYLESPSWSDHIDSIEHVVIESNVTSVGNGAFRQCASLFSVSIPTSVLSIGNEAFYGCTSLLSVTVPEGVASIGYNAFYRCRSLLSASIPASVASIGVDAFYDCTSLSAFTVAEANACYSSDARGALFDKGKTTLIQYPAGNAASSYGIPASVTSVESYAFLSCTSLVAVDIPEGVVSIGHDAFIGCSSLASVTVPSSVDSVGDNAFDFCSSLASVTILDGVESIGASAFMFCSRRVSVGIPASVESIGDNAFGVCPRLSSITVAEANVYFSSEGGVLFDKGRTELVRYPTGRDASSYAIPAGVSSVGDWAFEGCVSLTSVTIPASVAAIGNNAFSGCSSLLSVSIPASVLTVGYDAFNGCHATLYCEAPSKPDGWDDYWSEGFFGHLFWGQSGPSEPSDTVAPVLGAASASRRSASAATVTLTSSEAGSCYWAVVAPGAPVPSISTAGAGTPLAAGRQALEVAGLATGAAWDVCVVAKDEAGNVGAVLRVGVPAWEYTVTFRGWDGKAIGAAQKVPHGSSASAPAVPPRTGHAFAGWDKGFASVTADLTVTARYTANTYTVKLDANGGKVGGKASASVKRVYGTALGSLAKPARTGYTFLGWYTGKAGGSKVAAVAKVTRSVTYYAHWRANGPVVTLNAAGGKVGGAAAASVVKAKGAALGRLATPTYAGHAFLGWYTAKKGGTKVTAKTRVSRNVTYWAHWAKVHTVRLNAAGGKVAGKASASVKRTHNAKLGKLATPKRAGYKFLGWYTGKVGGKKVTSATKVTKAVTLYAHWKRAR